MKKDGEWEIPQDLAEMLRRLENVEAHCGMAGQVAEENALAGGCYLSSRIAVGGVAAGRSELEPTPLTITRLDDLSTRARNRVTQGREDTHVDCRELLAMVNEIKMWRTA